MLSRPELRPSDDSSMPKVRHAIPAIEWSMLSEDIDAIIALKKTPQRGHPGPQLPDAGHLSLRRGHRRRQPGAGA